MNQIEDLAITLKAHRFEERHQIVTALTANRGLIKAVARNSLSSRRFGGALEPMTAALWKTTEKSHLELKRLDSAITRKAFTNIRNDFTLLSIASALIEITLKILPLETPCPSLFKVLANALASLDELKPQPSQDLAWPLINAYILKCLQWSGTQPNLGECLECQKPLTEVLAREQLCFSIESAGWTCRDCKIDGEVGDRRNSLPAQVVAQLYGLMEHPIRRALDERPAEEQKDQKHALGILQLFLAYHIPSFEKSMIKSLQFIEPSGLTMNGPSEMNSPIAK